MFYKKIKTYNPFKYTYVYLDSNDYISNTIFKKNNMSIKISDIKKKEQTNYFLIICKFWKKDLNKFFKSMNDLQKRLMIIDKDNYCEICQELSNNHSNY